MSIPDKLRLQYSFVWIFFEITKLSTNWVLDFMHSHVCFLNPCARNFYFFRKLSWFIEGPRSFSLTNCRPHVTNKFGLWPSIKEREIILAGGERHFCLCWHKGGEIHRFAVFFLIWGLARDHGHFIQGKSSQTNNETIYYTFTFTLIVQYPGSIRVIDLFGGL